MLSSRMDVEEGVVNYKGTQNHIYEGGEGRCVGVGGEVGTPMRIRISLLFTFFSCAAFRVGFTCGNLH